MTNNTSPARFSRRADKPLNPNQRHRYDDTVLGKQGLVVNPRGCQHAQKTARSAVYMVFGRYGRALDQADFQDAEIFA